MRSPGLFFIMLNTSAKPVNNNAIGYASRKMSDPITKIPHFWSLKAPTAMI